MVEEVIDAAGAREQRNRMLPAWLTVYFSLALGLFSDVGARRVMGKLAATLGWAAHGVTVAVPSDEALSNARTRLGAEPLRLLFERAAGFAAEPALPGAFWRGLRLISLDSMVLNLQGTAANWEYFGRPRAGAGGLPPAFPQARVMVLAECHTHALAAAVIGTGPGDEARLARRIVPWLGEGTLVSAHIGEADAGLWRDAAGGGAELLWRVGPAVSLPVDRLLGDGTYLSHLDLRDPQPGAVGRRTPVRVIRYQAGDGAAGEDEPVTLITTLLDPPSAPARELAGHYQARWQLKTALTALRDDMSRPFVLRSKTPAGANQEIWALLCAYHAIREIICAVAVLARQDPEPVTILSSTADHDGAGQPAGFPPLTHRRSAGCCLAA